MKEEQKVIAALTPEQMKALIAFKPKGVNQTRTHTAALLILDGGHRISESLGLPFEDCDLENLVVKVRGKGGKHRLVPLSADMRKSRHSPANSIPPGARRCGVGQGQAAQFAIRAWKEGVEYGFWRY